MTSRMTREQLLKRAAVAAPGLLLAGGVAGADARPRTSRGGPDRDFAGMNVVMFMTDQQRAVQNFPPGWTKRNMPGLTRLQKHGMTFPNAFTNACMCSPARSTLDVRLLPGPARREVHARERHAGVAVPAGRARDQLQEPGHRHRCRRLQPGLQGQVPLRQAGQRLDLCPRGRQPIRVHPLEPAGRRRQPGRDRRGRRDLRQRRPLHELAGHARGRRRGRASVPQLSRCPVPAILPGRLAGQPPRRPLLSEDLRRPAATTMHGWRARSSPRRRPTRTCRPSRRSRSSS